MTYTQTGQKKKTVKLKRTWTISKYWDIRITFITNNKVTVTKQLKSVAIIYTMQMFETVEYITINFNSFFFNYNYHNFSCKL